MRTIRNTIAYWILICVTGSLFLQGGQALDNQKYWVFFRDKGTNGILQKNGFEAGLDLNISQRALNRRAKVRDENKLVDFLDLPVASEYIRQLEALGLECQVVSRWLNGVSVVIPKGLLDQVRSLSFVQKIQPVFSLTDIPLPVKMEKVESFAPLKPHAINYGYSYTQNQLIHVPEVHDLGLSGEGVLVGIIDSGFDYQGRSVFSHIDVVDEYDFVWDDHFTANEDGDPSNQHDHGTMIFSILGGFHEGYLRAPSCKMDAA